jgi:hypothetical protein
MNTTLKTTEIEEAVAAFANAGFDADAMRPLMSLIEGQTDYIQKRFWKLADERKFAQMWHAKLDAETVYRSYVAQNRLDEADAAWDHFIDICRQILDLRVALTK